MIVEIRAVEPFFKNGLILGCEETREAVLIDPGDEVGELLDVVRASGLQVKSILLTHAHLDHISGVGRAKAALGVPVWLHQADDFLYRAAVQQGIAFGFRIDQQPPVDFFYDGAESLRFGRYRVTVRHTPGHSPGGVCLAVAREDGSERVLIVGDTLFAGSIGRTDLPGGDAATLLRSINEVLFSYPDDTVVYPGHGPSTTVGKEHGTNPFLRS